MKRAVDRTEPTHVITGFVMGAGLVISGMTDARRANAFFDLRLIGTEAWDPTLPVVFACGLLVNSAIRYFVVRNLNAPLRAESFSLPSNNNIDAHLVVGSALFGAGWAFSGGCPGPLLVDSALGHPGALLCTSGVILGIGVHRAYKGRAPHVLLRAGLGTAVALLASYVQLGTHWPAPLPLRFIGTPSVFGGALIGTAAGLLAVVEGRVLGSSGMLAGVVEGKHVKRRAWFLAGLAAGANVFGRTFPRFVVAPTLTPSSFFAGIAVGLGTSIANGCTSGHGICGIARLSRRSIIATATFMTANALISSTIVG